MTLRRLAIVFCVHHKPWLMMATLLTTLIQDRDDADIYFVYNLGDGTSARGSYQEYGRIAAQCGINPQLSPFDERVRDVCQIRRDRVFELEYENDHALDSGVWYKFIREGRWRDYEQVLFLGEGALLAHPRLLDALLDFTARRQVHFVASGHEKRRIPRQALRRCVPRGVAESPIHRLHADMNEEIFRIFRRDPEFQAVYDRWGSDFHTETENHVPAAIEGATLSRRARARIRRDWGSPFSDPSASSAGRIIQRLPFDLDALSSRASLWAGIAAGDGVDPPTVFYNGVPRPVAHSEAGETDHGVRFHRETGPEWFGCTVLHLMSRDFLTRFSEKLDRFGMYEVLELPFAGSMLEVIWGMTPAWLGFEKWFTNGFHRVRKEFTTHQREDYPPEMASYINRYHRGRLAVGWHGDYLKVNAWSRDLGDLRQVLPPVYFQIP